MQKRFSLAMSAYILMTSVSQTLNAGHWEGGRTAEANFMDIFPAQRVWCSPSTEGSPGEQKSAEFKIWIESAGKLIPLASDAPSSVNATIEERIRDSRQFIREDKRDRFKGPWEDAVADLKARKVPSLKDAKETFDSYSDSAKDWEDYIRKLEEKKMSLNELEHLRELYLSSPRDKGVGFELKKVDGGLVEIWVLWPDKSGVSKRAQAAPILTIEEKSIDPRFYTSLEQKKFNSIDSFTGAESEQEAKEQNVDIEKLGEGHFTILDNGLGLDSHNFNIRDLVHFMDLGCYQRVIRKYFSTPK